MKSPRMPYQSCQGGLSQDRGAVIEERGRFRRVQGENPEASEERESACWGNLISQTICVTLPLDLIGVLSFPHPSGGSRNFWCSPEPPWAPGVLGGLAQAIPPHHSYSAASPGWSNVKDHERLAHSPRQPSRL